MLCVCCWGASGVPEMTGRQAVPPATALFRSSGWMLAPCTVRALVSMLSMHNMKRPWHSRTGKHVFCVPRRVGVQRRLDALTLRAPHCTYWRDGLADDSYGGCV